MIIISAAFLVALSAVEPISAATTGRPGTCKGKLEEGVCVLVDSEDFCEFGSANPGNPPECKCKCEVHNEKPVEVCCDTKTVGDYSYTKVHWGSGKVPSRCLNDCVYTRDDKPGTKYCFAEGEQEVHCHDDRANFIEDPTTPQFSFTYDPFDNQDQSTEERIAKYENGYTKGSGQSVCATSKKGSRVEVTAHFTVTDVTHSAQIVDESSVITQALITKDRADFMEDVHKYGMSATFYWLGVSASGIISNSKNVTSRYSEGLDGLVKTRKSWYSKVQSQTQTLTIGGKITIEGSLNTVATEGCIFFYTRSVTFKADNQTSTVTSYVLDKAPTCAGPDGSPKNIGCSKPEGPFSTVNK